MASKTFLKLLVSPVIVLFCILPYLASATTPCDGGRPTIFCAYDKSGLGFYHFIRFDVAMGNGLKDALLECETPGTFSPIFAEEAASVVSDGGVTMQWSVCPDRTGINCKIVGRVTPKITKTASGLYQATPNVYLIPFTSSIMKGMPTCTPDSSQAPTIKKLLKS